MSHAEQIGKYEQEIRRLDVLDQELDVLISHAPRYWYLALLAPVVFYYAGGGWAFVVLLVTASLVGTQNYLLRMRKSENRWNRDSLVRDVARLRSEMGAVPPEAG